MNRFCSVSSTEKNWVSLYFLPALKKGLDRGHLSRHDYYELRRGVLSDIFEEER